MFTLVSFNLGTPREVTYGDGHRLTTTLLRQPVSQKVFLDYLGFEGDQVSDPVNHGGREKAVCGYPADHYEFWTKELGRPMPPPQFGENLTLQGLTEDRIHIGDVFRIGEAEIQCTQPRQPCHKLTKILEYPRLASRIQATGFCGYYFRVLKQGWVQEGMPVELIHPDESRISIRQAHHLMYRDKSDFERLEQLIGHPLLSSSWKKNLEKRLSKL